MSTFFTLGGKLIVNRKLWIAENLPTTIHLEQFTDNNSPRYAIYRQQFINEYIESYRGDNFLLYDSGPIEKALTEPNLT